MPFLAPSAASCLQTREIAIVNINRLNMRVEAGTNYPVLKVLEKGAQVRVLKHLKGWLQVLHEGDVGYVADRPRYLKLYTIHTISDSSKTSLEIAKTRIKDIAQKIRNHQSEIVSYTKQEKKIIAQLLETDLALNKARHKADDIRADLAVANREISKIQSSVDKTRKTIQKDKGYAVNRVVSLYKLNMLGGMNLFASATSLNDLLKQQAAVEQILRYDHRVIGELVEKEHQLTGLLDRLNKKKAKKVELDKKYQATVHRLAAEKAKRKKILADIQTKKTNRLATVKYLKKAAVKLDHTIASLSRNAGPAIKKSQTFSAFKGLLKMPVTGTIILRYGKYKDPYSGTENFRNGIEIRSDRGAPIRAVFNGKTIYADWLKGYGNVIIIAHGDNYHTVYAHAEDLFKTKGENVETGEVIATVGDSGSMSGPSLYFEIRHQGNPVNPVAWLDNSI